MTVGRFYSFVLIQKKQTCPNAKLIMRQAGNQNWFLGNYSAALRNVRFYLVVILEGLEHWVHNSLVLGWFMVCCGSLFLKTVGMTVGRFAECDR